MRSQKILVSAFLLLVIGAGNTLLAQIASKISTTSSAKIVKLTPARLEAQVKKKIEAQPNISAEQITAFANLILEKRGYDYSFDVCEFLTFTKSNAISKRDEAYGTFLYHAPFFK